LTWRRPGRASPCCTARRSRCRTRSAALEETAATSAGKLLKAAAGRLGRACDRLEISGRAERAVVAASARADLLIVARDGDRTWLACPVLLVWPGPRRTWPPFLRRHITLPRRAAEAANPDMAHDTESELLLGGCAGA
jgi:hypothetical protein